MKKLLLTIAPILSLVPVLAHAEMNHSMHMQPPKIASNPYNKEYDAINMRMHKDMSIRYSGNPDVDFVKGMIAHHQGAVDMAKVQLEYGKDPEMRKLAENIISSQEVEIKEMKDWLSKQK